MHSLISRAPSFVVGAQLKAQSTCSRHRIRYSSLSRFTSKMRGVGHHETRLMCCTICMEPRSFVRFAMVTSLQARRLRQRERWRRVPSSSPCPPLVFPVQWQERSFTRAPYHSSAVLFQTIVFGPTINEYKGTAIQLNPCSTLMVMRRRMKDSVPGGVYDGHGSLLPKLRQKLGKTVLVVITFKRRKSHFYLQGMMVPRCVQPVHHSTQFFVDHSPLPHSLHKTPLIIRPPHQEGDLPDFGGGY